tara:strand:+ start:55 stop:1107 length:1053 start_codon:yes stop_codon:yes gene_type:complete
MSDKLPQEPDNSEVDLSQVFSAIGRLFKNLFLFLKKIFEGLFSILIKSLKVVVNNFKLFTISLMLICVLGFIADKFKKPVYTSDMLVKTYFGSIYQLAKNVDYFNALVESNSVEQLSNIFNIDTISSSQIIDFDIKIGPETKNDLLIEYYEYIKSIDSFLAEDLTFDDYIENRNILEGSIFSITATSHQMDVFHSLEKGFINTFENDYSKKLKKIRDESLDIKKAVYEKELVKIDSLQQIYIKIIKTESDNTLNDIAPSSLFPIMQQRTETREYDLFLEELKVRDKLRVINEILIEESDYYDILSGFNNIGSQKLELMDRFAVTLPMLTFMLMFLIFSLMKAFKYIKNYT